MNADSIPRKGETRKEAKVSRILPFNIQPTKGKFLTLPVMEKGPDGVKVIFIL